MKTRWRLLVAEFAHHFPYTVVGSLIAMACVWWFGTQSMAQGHANQLVEQGRAAFHLFHPLHICLSAIATTSLFWRYERSVFRASIVGALGTIIPCGLSDYVFPYTGGMLLGQPMHLHMCIVQHPQLFFSFLFLGILSGFWLERRMTGSHLFSHGAHVFVSSAASLLYLVSFGFTSWMADVRFVFPAFAIIVLAVWIPCCISDIVVPIATVSAHIQHEH
jgi:hypothetical protein